jgi:hypothetical protein
MGPYMALIVPSSFYGIDAGLQPPQSCTRKIFYQIIKINKTQILLKVFFWFHEVLNFLKNDGKMFKYSKRKTPLGHNVRAICWIVPKKYLFLLDQAIFLHFRSNIDRPLNPLPPYPCGNNYFSMWNFARDIWTVFEEIKHLRSRAPEKYFTRLLK